MAGFTVTRRGISEGRGAKLPSGQVPNIPRVVNVQDPAYGAKGDGTTDDTAAIQAAAFLFPTGAWVNPASTKRRFARFEWNGANWVCTSLATADY